MKTKNILNHLTISFVLIILILPMFAIAQTPQSPNTGTPQETSSRSVNQEIKINNPFKQSTITGLLETLINEILIPIGGVVAVLMIMYAGFMYVTARGDTAKIKTAHTALTWAVIGAAILLGAKIISTAIGTTINQLK